MSLLSAIHSGVIRETNKALEELTGHDADYFKGRSLQSLISNQTLPIVQDFPEKVSSNKTISDCEVSILNSKNEQTELAVNCSPRYDHRGRLVGMVLIGRPVGELRRAYAALDKAHHNLRNAQRQLIGSEKMAALGRLVAGVAHELNNPISFVFGNMHALKRYGDSITRYLKALDDDSVDADALVALRTKLKIDKIASDISPLVEGTLEGAERVSDIVQDLRRFSSGKKEAPETFDLIQIVRTAVEWVSKTVGGRPIVTFNCSGPFPISARKGHVHQIIVNLVQNAFDVMADQDEPRIIIGCEKKDGDVLISVRDFGPGILPKDMPHIFEPFFTAKPIGEGTGLGLYISYGLADEQGGSIVAENHPEGGAVFTLKLPLDEDNES